MASIISNLLSTENELKVQLKTLRKELKDAIMATDMYKSVLEQTMNADVKVSKKLAQAHALKVVRSSFEGAEEDEEDTES